MTRWFTADCQAHHERTNPNTRGPPRGRDSRVMY